jgi:N-acetylmuramoyl-L-alanine amidase
MVPGDFTPPPIVDKSESILPEEKFTLPGGILPVSAWQELCGFTSSRILQKDYPQSIELTSPAGVLQMAVGQRYAKWNGINLGLGFAPSLQQGQIALHSLDVSKNVHALVFGVVKPLDKRRVLVIDPGHGGRDSGSKCVGRNTYEKELTLDWALRIQRLLTNSSWTVLLTRDSDRETPLLDRVQFADAQNADLFISLHFNSLAGTGTGGDESGAETYCLTPAGLPSNIQRGYEDDPRRVFPNNVYDTENVVLAMRIQSNLVKLTNRRDRGVRRARFMTVLREQKRPAVLVEGGFLSNPVESRQILQPEFREQLAKAICESLPE